SWIEPRLLPRITRVFSGEAYTIVQAIGPVHPELDLHRIDPVTAPVRRAGYFLSVEALFDFGDARLEGRAAVERARLVARPGADLRRPRTGCEVGVRFGGAHALDGSAHAHLPADRLPVHDHGRLRVCGEFAALGAL